MQERLFITLVVIIDAFILVFTTKKHWPPSLILIGIVVFDICIGLVAEHVSNFFRRCRMDAKADSIQHSPQANQTPHPRPPIINDEDNSKVHSRKISWKTFFKFVLVLVVLAAFIDGMRSPIKSAKRVIQEDNADVILVLPNDVTLEMKRIPAGTFTMGSSEDECGRFEEEVQHQVPLTNDFWLGQYEVTQAQYAAVMGHNPSKFKGDNLPVDGVSWNDAMTFCEKLNALYADNRNLPEDYQFTLPTEAQWEYACRAGTTTSLNNGKDITTGEGTCPNLDEVGWYQQNSDREPHPVGQKGPNAWGLYDMHGNAGEWCLDWYEDYPIGPVTDSKGTVSGSNRVMRGGSWIFRARYCRSACRAYDTPDSKTYDLGFRVALAKAP